MLKTIRPDLVKAFAPCEIQSSWGTSTGSYRSLLVTSAAPGEGKTTTAANLAAAHAEQNRRTLLIDGDLRRPNVHRNFNISGAVGLSNVLLGEITWREALQAVTDVPDLYILPAGPPSRRAGDLVGRGMVELLEAAVAEYDLVIVDAPPLLGFAEPLQMATARGRSRNRGASWAHQPQGRRYGSRDAQSTEGKGRGARIERGPQRVERKLLLLRLLPFLLSGEG